MCSLVHWAGVVLYAISDMVEIFLRLNLGARHMRGKIAKLNDHYIVCGYGRTGQEVIKHFKENKVDYVVIEQDSERAKQAIEAGCMVVQGDATVDKTLLDAQLMGALGIVCALPDDSANTFIALSAKGLNESMKIVCRAANPAPSRRPHGDFALYDLR